jgi:hypothetical protein
MSKINRIVTSQVEGQTSARNEPNTYSYDSDGVLVRSDSNRVDSSVVGPGVLYGANGDSSEMTGLNTIKLIPNEELMNLDQYLIIEPTTPDHIHIRAGGTVDESGGTLILGGERTAVLVSDDLRSVGITTRAARITEIYTNVAGNGGSQFVSAFQEGFQISAGWKILLEDIEYTVASVTSDTPTQGYLTLTIEGVTNIGDGIYTFYSDPQYDNLWSFNSNGYISGPGMGGILASAVMNYQSDLYLQSQDNVYIESGDNHDIYLSPGSGGKIFLQPSAANAYIGTENAGNRIARIVDLATIRTSVPATSLGLEGHVIGMVADDATHHYYCTANYDGTTHIWKRVAWDAGNWGV